MDAARTCTALFHLDDQLLTVTKTGSGTGLVTSTPAGIDCGATCTAFFYYTTPVTLTPAADTGSQFMGWGGIPDCWDGALTVAAPTTCTALFELDAVVIFTDGFESGDTSAW